MLARHMLGYLPSLIIPALAAFTGIYCYTRLLSPDEYGLYILILNSMALINVLCFYWLQVSLPRLMPQAVQQEKQRELFTTAVIAFAAIALMLAVLTLLFSLLHPGSSVASLGLYVVALALARALLSLRQMVHRSMLNLRRYNLLECGQSLLGLFFGLVFVYSFHWGAKGIVAGTVLGLGGMLVLESKSFLQVSLRYFSRTFFHVLLRFGLPLVVTYGFVFILSSADRFLIEHFYGAAQVGQYAAGYSLVDRIITHVFMIVTTPSFPLAIYALETAGIPTARNQTHTNGIAILLLALPACAGLILASPILTALLLGPEFRAAALHTMPWIAFASLLNGLATHYFDHVFHLAKKPYLLLLTQGPAALLNIGLNLFLLPRIGLMGAVIATVCAYALQLTLSIVVGRHAFANRFPFKEALQITAATLVMSIVIAKCHFPSDAAGLAGLVLVGGAVYLIALTGLNLLGLRTRLSKAFQRR